MENKLKGVVQNKKKEKSAENNVLDSDKNSNNNSSEYNWGIKQFKADSDENKVKINNTGIPDDLKSNMEYKSGFSFDDVKVHYNSSKPKEVGALAYTQGNQVYMGPGQDKHLGHELGHVVQQKQGRVKPTTNINGMSVNDDSKLEHEADIIGAKTVQMVSDGKNTISENINFSSKNYPIQMLQELTIGKKNYKFKGSIEKGKGSKWQLAIKDPSFKSSKAYIEFMERVKEKYSEEKIEEFALILINDTLDKSMSIEQFIIELEYDLESKAYLDKELTIQERYMTERGWRRADESPDKAIIKEGSEKNLKIYRTMSVKEYQEIAGGNYDALGAHLGDFKEALRYYLGNSDDSKVMAEFTLKEGAEQELFSSRLAFPKEAERSDKLKRIAKVINSRGNNFPVCSKDQGTSDTAIGIKSETSGEAGFSIGIGGGSTPNLFKSLIKSVEIRSIGGKGVKPAKDTKELENKSIEAQTLINVNNCLINAITNAAFERNATLDELIAIRGQMNNYGEMLYANANTIAVIRNVLNIRNTIVINYTHAMIGAEEFTGDGEELNIYHINGNHFVCEREYFEHYQEQPKEDYNPISKKKTQDSAPKAKKESKEKKAGKGKKSGKK